MLPHTRIALICGGPIESPQKIQEKISKFPCLVAVNGGINNCRKLDIRPDLVIGDMDSAEPDLLKSLSNIPTKSYPKEKDQTDLEIALALVSSNAQEMTIFGALQGRTDHMLG